MYVTVDTSVLVAAFFNPTGLADRLITRSLRSNVVLLCLSETILEELEHKLTEFGACRRTITNVTTTLRTDASICNSPRLYTVAEIAADEHILGCYFRCDANLVLTNDKALVRRLTKLDIAAVKPSQFKTYLPK